jgi:DNA-binding NarL/FixJ family response regulator
LTRVIGFSYPVKVNLQGEKVEDNTELRYLDGPKLVEWLKEENVDYSNLSDNQKRRWFDWSKGARADVYSLTLDQIMTDNYLSSRLIPDDVWSKEQARFKLSAPRRSAKEQRATRDEGKLLLRAGCSHRDVARKLGVSRNTVRNWANAMEDDLAAVA